MKRRFPLSCFTDMLRPCILLICGLAICADTMTDMCNRCLNNSTCRIVTNIQSNVSVIHCACAQGWFGDRCQVRMRLLLVSVTMTTVTLKWEASTSDSQKDNLNDIDVSNLQLVPNNTDNNREHVYSRFHDVTSSRDSPETKSLLTRFDFNVNYWTERRWSECNIIPNLTKSVFTLSGLDGDTKYTFCAKTDQSYSCDFDLVSHAENITDACVSVTTKPEDKVMPVAFLAVTSCVAVIGVVILIIVVIISKRNNYFSILICAKHDDKKRRHNRSALQTVHVPAQEESTSDAYLLTSSNSSQLISFDLPNCPGKPKYKIKKRLRGYASFSAQNEQTIPLSTVLEYSEHVGHDEEEHSDVDSDVIENLTEIERLHSDGDSQDTV